MRKHDIGDYMSPSMRSYFKGKLIDWLQDINKQLAEEEKLFMDVATEGLREPDHADVAANEAIMQNEVFSINNNLRLISQIKEALLRIEKGTYGYCEETGGPIGFKRLNAWPIARLSLEAQEQLENF